MRQTVGFSLKLLIVLVIFAVLFSYAMFQGGFVSWFLFIAFLPFLLYMFFLLFYPMQNWQMERRLSKRIVQAGESVHIEVILTRKFPFPLYYCVMEEYFPATLQKKDTHLEKYKWLNQPERLEHDRIVKAVTFPWFRKRISFHYELDQVPRGEHKLGSLRIKTGDFFGFIKKEHVFKTGHTLIAFPYQRNVQFKERVYSYEQGASPSVTMSDKNTNIVAGVRDYMPGDRFQWIDWKTTAKKNEIMTKEFEQEKSMDMVLVLDACFHEGMNPIAFEGAVELADSLMKVLYEKSSNLTVITIGDKKGFFPFQQDQRQRDNLRRHFSVIKPSGRVSFGKQLRGEQLPPGIILMVVTTVINQEIKDSMERLAQKSKRVVLFLVTATGDITDLDRQLIRQLNYRNITVNVLTEEQLIKQQFEVNT
ncbi:DUF58 domain-containing protein [Thalassobacillus pellis]|uniref:DUF58 domain-containing protein n=1 Tax=Thalassobacillus pellis TaxID=748008 RepID=UPI00196022F4|nr:DUF58 domain-containing protein [Thalassobacillus pellis]MBM7553392.1 uncharacterized protein (DUF58 family) [Thalassobacillus pellis]